MTSLPYRVAGSWRGNGEGRKYKDVPGSLPARNSATPEEESEGQMPTHLGEFQGLTYLRSKIEISGTTCKNKRPFSCFFFFFWSFVYFLISVAFPIRLAALKKLIISGAGADVGKRTFSHITGRNRNGCNCGKRSGSIHKDSASTALCPQSTPL